MGFLNALTQEQRDALISFNKEQIRIIENYLNEVKKERPLSDIADATEIAFLETHRIALAALEAEPELWEIVNPGEGTFYTPNGPRDFETVYANWYPAPPVPVLKPVVLPEVGKFCQGLWPYACSAMDEYNKAVKQALKTSGISITGEDQ